MSDRKSGRLLKIIAVSIAAFILVFQLYQSFYKPVTTSSVVHYETYNGIEITAYAIRDEEILTTESSGVISYNVEDGGKIEKDGSVANIYSSEEEADNQVKISNLQKAIKDLEEIEGYNDIEAVDIDMLDARIDNKLLELISRVNKGVISGDDTSSEDLLKLLNRRQIVTGVSDGFDELLSSYKAELKAIKSSSGGPKARVKTKKPGYFVSNIDGYENVLNSKNIKKLTAKKLKNAKPIEIETSGRAVGKIVSDYEWYLAAVISLDDSLKLTEDTELTLLTQFDSVKKLPVKVKYINKGSLGNDALVVFSCTYMNNDLANMRKHDMKIVLESYSGLQVDSKAIRFVDGKKGVYVVSGSVMNFVPVNVLYSTDSYSICETQTTGVRLKLYDEVVIKGKNLYDGKVIR